MKLDTSWMYQLSSQEMELSTWVQILGKVVCVSLRTNALKKGMNLSILFPPNKG